MNLNYKPPHKTPLDLNFAPFLLLPFPTIDVLIDQ